MVKRIISKRKISWYIPLGILLFTVLLTQVSCNSKSETKQKEWVDMDCKERTAYIEKLILQSELENVSELEMSVKKEVVAQYGVQGVMSFDASPSIYDGSAQVLISSDDIDRVQIVVPFRCTLSNIPNSTKSIHYTGQVVYQYDPKTKGISVNNWNLTENI